MRDRDRAIERAIVRFKTLVTYITVTRPQYQSEYKTPDGKFDKDKLISQMRFLSEWHKSPNKHQARTYTRISSTFNYTFNCPVELVKQVLGSYVDEDGNQHRIPIKEIVQRLTEEGWLSKTMNAGSKTRKNADGKIEKTCWWNKKYFMNEKAWFAKLNDPRYSDYRTYPSYWTDPDVKATVSKISSYFKNIKPEYKEEPAPAPQPTPPPTPAPSPTPSTIEDREKNEWLHRVKHIFDAVKDCVDNKGWDRAKAEGDLRRIGLGGGKYDPDSQMLDRAMGLLFGNQ